MKKKVKLPRDELPHKDQAIEWWYFNGFLKGKSEYAFMTCLFKADKKKVNLSFLKMPYKTIYFSHSLLFNLKTGKIKKEVLPFVIVSEDSFKREGLFVDYVYPLKKKYVNYEIARTDGNIKVKTGFFDLLMREKKKPMYEDGSGFINLGNKTTYYYSYTNMEVKGYVDGDKVKGKAWHDKQWSSKGFTRDSWLWFSFQLADDTEIVCFDYKGKKLATISYPNNRQETIDPIFKAVGKTWKSKKTKKEYKLEWEIKIKDFKIRTRPIIKDCEMSFGFINYWEGPIELIVNGSKNNKSRGFMEYLCDKKDVNIKDTIMQKFNAAEFYKKNKIKIKKYVSVIQKKH